MPYVFILVLLLLWFKGTLERKKSFFNAGISALAGMVCCHIIAILYYHPRPFAEHLGTQLIPHANNASFPSNHGAFLFCIAVMLLFNKTTRALGSVLCVLALIGSTARVLCGVHFPFDILGSIVVAIFSSVVVFSFDTKISGLFNFFSEKLPKKLR